VKEFRRTSRKAKVLKSKGMLVKIVEKMRRIQYRSHWNRNKMEDGHNWRSRSKLEFARVGRGDIRENGRNNDRSGWIN
jgi:hypothetical protein